MDNITHSLIGVAIGTALSPTKKPSREKNAAIWTAILASNLPDLDFFWHTTGGEGGLGYLLQHRGYTHTLLLTIPLGLFAAFLSEHFAKTKANLQPRLILIGIFSAVIHIAADFCNNYGVHPLSPFFDRWFYGDTLFILEPLIWAAFLPLAYETFRSKTAKRMVLVVAAFLLGLLWFGPFNTVGVAALVTAMGLLIAWLQRGSTSLRYVGITLLLILLAFGGGSWRVQSFIADYRARLGIRDGKVEVVATPAPANPFCWSVLLVGLEGPEQDREYVVRSGVVNLVPKEILGECRMPWRRGKSNGLQVATLPDDGQLRWLGEFRGSLKEFEFLKEKSCRFSAFLRFSRVPHWFREGDSWYAGDLRYDRAGAKSFSQMEVTPSEKNCPVDVPPWEPPISRIF